MGDISLPNTTCLKGGGFLVTRVGVLVDWLKFTPFVAFGENACTLEDTPATGELPSIKKFSIQPFFKYYT